MERTTASAQAAGKSLSHLPLQSPVIALENSTDRVIMNEYEPAIPYPEVKFPDFDEDSPLPMECVRSCSKYFKMYQIPEKFAAFHAKGVIENSFEEYLFDPHGKGSCSKFSLDFCKRFNPTAEEQEERAKNDGHKRRRALNNETEEEEVDEMEVGETALRAKVESMRPIETIKLLGMVKNTKSMVILIDSGSTHSYLSPEIVNDMGLRTVQTGPLKVVVANGDELSCDLICPNFKWTVQEEPFEKDLWLLKMGGCDMVLGMDWVDEFTPVLIDTRPPSISFHKEDRWIKLYGIPPDQVVP